LGILVKAANITISKSIGGGKLKKGLRPGIIVLIQTHSNSMEFNPHLHILSTDGSVDYRDPGNIRFRHCAFWDTKVMTELFRMELVSALVKKGVLDANVADNMFSWKHSGFHVHASESFYPSEDEKLKNRLSYAFRPPVALSRLTFNRNTVRYTTRKTNLILEPIEFIARVTLHIPDRYQNIRRYAGFYASNVQRKVRLVKGKCSRVSVELRCQIKPNWARLIAHVFDELPIVCPKCSSVMELKEFILDVEIIHKTLPRTTRAPPRKVFERYSGDEDIAYELFDELAEIDISQTSPLNDQAITQAIPEKEEFFNQELGW
jgi:hypothetical protein